MRVLLSTIGSRGEVQPLVALALRLREIGCEVRACVPPDFQDWIERLGFAVVPIGPRLRPLVTSSPAGGAAAFSPEQRRRLIEGTVEAQFTVIPEAARDCEVVVGLGALQVAARSAAQLRGIGYLHAHFCPITLPSPHHAPPPLGLPRDPAAGNRELWEADARHWDEHWGPALNSHRRGAGLQPVDDVRRHLLTDRPILAADPTLGPWPEPEDPGVVQTGAWLVPDERPLPVEVEAFLDRGEPPVYVGLGSMRAPGAGFGDVAVASVRALGRRVIVSRGWADLVLPDDGTDCVAVDDVNHRALFRRVAAVVHHGGAGTTTVAAAAGSPQLILPQRYDQPYWAERVTQLGIGVTPGAGEPGVESLATALTHVLRAPVVDRARSLASSIRTDGAWSAARLVLAESA
jgi:vancomycin aglycone glucosyltransferase